MSNAMETTPKPSWLRIVLGFLVLSTGLATIFTGVITAWQAWEEHLYQCNGIALCETGQHAGKKNDGQNSSARLVAVSESGNHRVEFLR